MIKVLVVDDDATKVQSIRKTLMDAGVGGDNIEVAATGIDARRLLAQTKFDLLVLDVVLPLRTGDPVDRHGGIQLLREIAERDIFKHPRTIIGLTAFDDLQEEFQRSFSLFHWQLDKYDRMDLGWISRLRARVEYMLKVVAEATPIDYGVDVCVLTALDRELEGVRRLDWAWSAPTMLGDTAFVYEGRFVSGEGERSVIAASVGEMGMVKASILATRLIDRYRPRLLAMTGICGGVRGSTEIGDALLIDPTWDWQMGKFVESVFNQRPEQLDVSPEVKRRFDLLGQDSALLKEIRDRFVGAKPGSVPRLKVGPVPSGSAVLADGKLLEELRKRHDKIVGVEMECFGVYAAVKHASHPRPLALGLKCVSDYCDDTKSDEFQEYAIHVSASIFGAFCERYVGEVCRMTGRARS